MLALMPYNEKTGFSGETEIIYLESSQVMILRKADGVTRLWHNQSFHQVRDTIQGLSYLWQMPYEEIVPAPDPSARVWKRRDVLDFEAELC